METLSTVNRIVEIGRNGARMGIKDQEYNIEIRQVNFYSKINVIHLFFKLNQSRSHTNLYNHEPTVITQHLTFVCELTYNRSLERPCNTTNSHSTNTRYSM